MNNLHAIDQIRSESTDILNKLKDRKHTEFALKELDFENGISLRGIPVTGQAAAKILNTLRVKKNFTDIGHKMSPEDWSLVSYKLKTAEGETKMHGSITGGDDAPTISLAYNSNENKKRSDDQLNYENYFNWLTTSLGESEINYDLRGFHYNANIDKFTLTLLDNSTELDVFGTGLDMWKSGSRFTFSGLYYNYAPFFERLVCSNGNTAMQYGQGADISKQRFNNHKVENSIRGAILQRNNEIPIILNDAVQHLQNNNVSVGEFYAYKGFFNARNENGKYDRIISQFFNEKPFYQAYGTNIAEKSLKWKSTANSGINGYKFFNMLTYIASHPQEIAMDQEDRLQLQIQASNLLFKKQLDLEDIAAHVSINYPILSSMN